MGEHPASRFAGISCCQWQAVAVEYFFYCIFVALLVTLCGCRICGRATPVLAAISVRSYMDTFDLTIGVFMLPLRLCALFIFEIETLFLCLLLAPLALLSVVPRWLRLCVVSLGPGLTWTMTSRGTLLRCRRPAVL